MLWEPVDTGSLGSADREDNGECCRERSTGWNAENYRAGDRFVKSGWVRIGRQAKNMDIVGGTCYRLHDQEEEVDKAFFKQSKKSHNHRPWLSWRFLTTSISPREIKTQATSNSDFWNVPGTTFRCRFWTGWKRGLASLRMLIMNKAELVGDKVLPQWPWENWSWGKWAR